MGKQSQRTESASESSTPSESYPLLHFCNNDDMVKHVMLALDETNDGIHEWIINRIGNFDRKPVWECFQEAPPHANAKKAFISMLKKKRQDWKMRQGTLDIFGHIKGQVQVAAASRDNIARLGRACLSCAPLLNDCSMCNASNQPCHA